MTYIPKPGDFYKHFKNKLYQIITVAAHSETGESLVIYQALYGDFKTYARPLDMFLSKVDKEKYPDVAQEYRFEKVLFMKDTTEEEMEAAVEPAETLETVEHLENGGINSVLLDFLDAESYEDKISVLTSKRKYITDGILNDMAISLDITVENGELQGRIDGFLFCLQTLKKFEGSRLR